MNSNNQFMNVKTPMNQFNKPNQGMLPNQFNYNSFNGVNQMKPNMNSMLVSLYVGNLNNSVSPLFIL